MIDSLYKTISLAAAGVLLLELYKLQLTKRREDLLEVFLGD